MLLSQIKATVAALLDISESDLTVDGFDLFLNAVNQTRKTAELLHDFEFSRKLVTLTVNGTTGGGLHLATVYGTSTVVKIKSVIEVGMFDDFGNLRPSEWTTVSESLERQRGDNRYGTPRYPTDGWVQVGPSGQGRFNFAGNQVYRWPLDSDNDYALGMEVYTFNADWSAVSTIAVTGGTGVTGVNTSYYPYGTFNEFPFYLNITPATAVPATIYAMWYSGSEWRISLISDVGSTPTNYHSLTTSELSPVGTYSGHGTFTGTAVVAGGDISDIWTEHGSDYLIWGSLVWLNHRFKHFVFRQEGNLAPPEKMTAQALEAFRQWDIMFYEQSRRHGR